MATYSMTCSCGDVQTLEAGSREEAVKTLQSVFTQEALDGHMVEKHPGQEKMTLEQAHGMVEQYLVAV